MKRAWLSACAAFVATSYARALPAEAGFVHPRRAMVEIESRRKAALLLDADTAWSPATDAARATRVCVGENCAGIVTPESCSDAPCPKPGVRLVLDRALGNFADWPSDDDDEEALIEELGRDPVLARLLAGRFRFLVPITWGFPRAYVRPTDPPEPPFFWELTAAAVALGLHREERLTFGADLAAGISKSFDYSRPSDWAFGNVWGASLRFGSYLDARGDAGPLRYAISLSLDNYNIVGPFERSRLRAPALMGVVVPELGFVFNWNTKHSPFVRFRLPFGVLVARSLALDIRPSFGIVYVTPEGEPDWFLGLSLGALWRLP